MGNKRAYEVVVEYIHQQLQNNLLLPGDKLPSERVLARELSVSRTSVREGLRELEQNYLIEIISGKGSFVRKQHVDKVIEDVNNKVLSIDNDFIYDMLDFRRAIEVEAARLAANRATARDLKIIKNILVDMHKAKHDSKKGIEADLAFHQAIMTASHNMIFKELMTTLQEAMEETIRQTRSLRARDEVLLDETYDEHKEIYLAILEGNDEKSGILMETHIKQIKAEIISLELNELA